jgi:hypothetical protein
MPDYLASRQPGTGLKKTNDAEAVLVPEWRNAVWHFFGPVLDWDDRCRNADAGVSFLDADAHLCQWPYKDCSAMKSFILLERRWIGVCRWHCMCHSLMDDSSNKEIFISAAIIKSFLFICLFKQVLHGACYLLRPARSFLPYKDVSCCLALMTTLTIVALSCQIRAVVI